MTSSINADAENWYSALELDPDNNQFEHENGIFVVVVSRVTEGDETKLVLDRTFSGDTTLKSKILSGVFGKLKFKIVDTAKLKIESTNQDKPATLFYKVYVYEASKGPRGVQFKTVSDETVKDEVATDFASGN